MVSRTVISRNSIMVIVTKNETIKNVILTEETVETPFAIVPKSCETMASAMMSATMVFASGTTLNVAEQKAALLLYGLI